MESPLYKLFGVNAKLLIDHAWGWEPCTIADIKAYQPETSSLSSGQVLQSPYAFEKAKKVVFEMADLLVLDLVDQKLVTDGYGRKIPRHAHGTVNLKFKTASTRLITEAVMSLYDQIVDKNLLVRRTKENRKPCNVKKECSRQSLRSKRNLVKMPF